MVRSAVSLVVGFVLFAGAFALHVVGGATGQDWLFALAVALIYLTAAGFPAIAAAFAGRMDMLTGGLGGLIGAGLTSGALWASNDRAWGWWTVPLAAVLVALTSSALWWTWHASESRRGGVTPRGAA